MPNRAKSIQNYKIGKVDSEHSTPKIAQNTAGLYNAHDGFPIETNTKKHTVYIMPRVGASTKK